MGNDRGIWTFLLVINFSVIIQCSWPLSSCKGKRTIYTAPNGTVESGVGADGTYTNFSRCEWLIDAGGVNKSILLEFREMDTECSYDFLFIFDGQSYNSKLVASVSGNTLPQPIVARTGFMLIYLFTDRNYNLEGFVADYKVQDCPFNCHGRGACVNNKCVCNSYYTGQDCELRICPNSCGFGDCKTINGEKICKCNGGVMGEGCDLPIHGRNGTGMWYRLAPSTESFLPRTAHAGVFVREEECLYIYGGYTLNEVLGDLVRFCVRNSQWEAVQRNNHTDFWPAARKEHRMVKYGDGFYIFGGMLSDGSHCNDLLFYNLTSQTWSQKAVNSSLQPQKLTGHSLTLVNNWLYVIGGKMDHGLFSSSIYRYDINSSEDSWEEVYLRGGRPVQQLLVGHTAVYHKESRSIIVFGGYSALQARFAKLSSRLFMLNVETLYWGEVDYPEKQRVYSSSNIQRAYHSASIMGNYMVVYGGNVHVHNSIETCYDNKIHLYHLGCHQWIKHPSVHSHSAASNGEPKKGRFGHVAVPAYNNILLIVGGYSGYVRGDLVAYKLQGVVSPPENEEDKDLDHCENYADPQHERCPQDPECAFCMEKRDTRMPGCVHRTRLDKCADARHAKMYNCSGLCYALHTCQSCLTHGHQVTLNERSPRHRFYQHDCVWCVRNSTCSRKSDKACSSSLSSYVSGITGWWNGSNTKWEDVDQCSLDEIPAGIQMVTHYNPSNSTQPDEVKILHSTEELLDYELYKGKTDGYLQMTLKGFIHPLSADPIYGTDKLRVFLITSGLPTVLRLSNDSTPEKLEVVAMINKTNSPGARSVESIRNGSRPLFPNTARGYKYLFTISGMSDMNEKQNSTVSVEWNIASRKFVRGKQVRPFTLEFLEQYHSPHCSRHHNCLACMSNAECGWCPYTDTCDHKGSNSSLSSCVGPDPQAYLITQPADCVQCSDYVDCHSCASDELCEWITKDVRCTRRWRVHTMIKDPAYCPVACHRRMSCTSCISPNSECFWCENTETCLPFAHYISRFVNGQCREWMDSEGIESYSCKNCSSHTVCESCLAMYGCGWCSDPENPSIGRCADGDFAGPYHGQNCSVMIHDIQNRTEVLPADWSYQRCPDVNECILGFHDCHENATCENIHSSYLCHCNRGFKGDGRHCVKTCHYTCVHGNCSEAPDYECRCRLGYTGPDCNTSCQCNHRSTCSQGVGLCDECQHNTTGYHCEKCVPGFHGDPANLMGCEPCECNGHGDVELGLCSPTGQCYCVDHTTGDHCQVCEGGHYGKPVNGGRCYRSCDTPTVLNSTSGYIGSYRGTGVRDWHAYCIWIIAPLSGEELVPVRGDSQYDTPQINITIEDIDTDCGWDYVYVYDGIPDFIDGSQDAWGTLLGVFCGNTAGYSVLAKSRIVTIYFETDISKHMSEIFFLSTVYSNLEFDYRKDHRIPGFNASYHMNKCPSVCPINKVCEGDRCICESGHDGPDCDNYMCTDNCTFIQDKFSCSCQSNFHGGSTFSIELIPWFYQAVPGLSGWYGQWNRYGHTLTACGDELLYMFGGYSLEKGLLNDLWVFNITFRSNWNQWYQIKPITIDEPEGRYYHAAACVPIKRQLFIYGGFIKDRTGNQKYKASNELWSFNIGGRKWTRMSVPALVKPVAGHTMTRIEETQLLIIGGFSTENYFSDMIYKFDTNVEHGNAWSDYGRGSLDGAVPLGLYGHTAVYHEQTNAIFVYGGMLFHIDKFSVSDQLYVLNLDEDRKQWNVLQAEEGSQKDARFLHTAVDMGDYMVVMGGRTDSSNFSNSILIYRYLCNYWHKFDLGDLAFSRPLHSVVAPSSVVVNSSIYVMGGLDHFVHSEIIKLDLPSDVCSLIGDLNRCVNSSGCSACIMSTPGAPNRTYCYSNSRPEPAFCEAPHVTVITGEQCSLQWHLERSCYQYKTCSQCLAVFPHFKQNSKACKWCTNCPQGKCIPFDGECKLENECDTNTLNQVKLEAGQCEEFSCTASDCDKCHAHSCVWSNDKKRQAEMRLILAGKQPFEWGCFLSRTVTEGPLQYSNSQSQDVCPARCYTYTTCTSCLKSIGSEGGSKECIWSEMLQECMPPAYHHLHCAGGECGLIIQATRTKCPRPCMEYQWCSDCLQAPGCGWCAFLGLNGKGVCMRGGVKSPIGGRCEGHVVEPGEGELPEEDKPFLRLSNGAQWVFTKCLSENECLNNHHNCDKERQRCIDKSKGFLCECKKGYLWKERKGICEPVCHQGCVHGVCDAPDHCTCDFGWVGNDCSTKCMCNGYSKCRSALEKDSCLACVNNTLGTHCEHCEQLYVGSPENKKPCVPCLEHCHNHTPNCTFGSINNHSYPPYFWDSTYHNFGSRGPKEDEALCLNCMYNTEGRRCEKCLEGYFRVEKEGKTAFDKCIKCQCHGHSDMCDSKSGLNCRCANNTESPCQSQKIDKESVEKCWQKQCSACKEYFLGTPTNGHQCYRQMTVDRDYCLDPDTQKNCNQNPGPLLIGRTVFFAVQPRYLNVDIRVTIDITKGGVDIYFSSSDQTFIVDVSKVNGFHSIKLDPTLASDRTFPHPHDMHGGRHRRSVQNSSSHKWHELIELKANDFHTYHTVKMTHTILIIQNVQSRVVITLPLELGLKTSKFYVVMYGRGGQTSNQTYGNLYFRQDQTHIDLFVFFSVFFSSFFLFLAMCVLLWKLKQAVDAQRSRRERAKEMMHMASRPFARVLILIEPEPMPFVSTPLPRRTKYMKLSNRNTSGMALTPVDTLQLPFQPMAKEEHPFDVVAMAIEPTDDGISAVRTAMFQMPGGPTVPTKLCLGSTLTLSVRAAMMGMKVTSRRRPSSTVC